MSPAAESFARVDTGFDMTLGCSAKRAVYLLCYNGYPVGQHATREDADATADKLCATVATSRSCFEVREVWR